jgi:DNA repair protein RecN (Recombination protein N)
MEGLVEKELQQLGMPHCRFQVQFVHKNAQGIVSRVEDATVEGLSHCGLDHVEYLISPNPGEGFQSMAKIASGGELSRILLALKVALIQTDPVSTYIFDEVDTGIGGGIAETVGHKLQQVGTSRQVLCISHLPQVISSAHHHLQVRKQVVDNRTSSTADYLDMEQRVNEVARMLGGIEITDKTRAHAQEMIRVNQPKVLHLHERKLEQMG